MPTWINIYGAPDGVELGEHKREMNCTPDVASNWRSVYAVCCIGLSVHNAIVERAFVCNRGRIMIAAREELDPKKVEPEEVHKKLTSTPPMEVQPLMTTYTFKALVLSGCMHCFFCRLL